MAGVAAVPGSFTSGLTSRSTRVTRALFSALSQRLPSSTQYRASIQAGLVGLVREAAGVVVLNPISPKISALSLSEYWSPRVIGEVDDSFVKVAKVLGSLTWHSHEFEDELFYVLKGHLRIEMEKGSVELDEGEMFVVPKGVRHNPVAEEECHLMLFERKATLHTGDVKTEKTRSITEQLRPLQ